MSQVIHSAAAACRDCGEAVGNVHRWSCGRYRVGEVAGRLVESVECGPMAANAIVGVEPLRSAAADDTAEAVAAPLAAQDVPLGGHTASDHAALLERFNELREQARLAAKHVLKRYSGEIDTMGEALAQGDAVRLTADAQGIKAERVLRSAMALVDEPRVKACVACKWSKVMAGSKGLLCHYNPPGPAGFPPVLATDWCREFSVGGQ